MSPNDFGHVNYFSVGIDDRTLAEIEKQYNQNKDPQTTKSNITIAEAKGIRFDYKSSDNSVIYISYKGQTYRIDVLTTKNVPEAPKILTTFKFTK